MKSIITIEWADGSDPNAVNECETTLRSAIVAKWLPWGAVRVSVERSAQGPDYVRIGEKLVALAMLEDEALAPFIAESTGVPVDEVERMRSALRA